MNGTSLIIIAKGLNHRSSAATEIYARLSADLVKRDRAANQLDADFLRKTTFSSLWEITSYSLRRRSSTLMLRDAAASRIPKRVGP